MYIPIGSVSIVVSLITDQRETKTGTNLAGRFRHRWISKAKVPLGRVFFSLLPTTWARRGGGGGGELGGPPPPPPPARPPLLYYFKTVHSTATKSAHNNVLIISHYFHIAEFIDRNHISLK